MIRSPRQFHTSVARAANPSVAFAAVLYTALVAYGTLLPFHFTWRPFDSAVDQFAATGFLDLGLMDRADWIANGVLFAPLGALIAAALQSEWRTRARVWLAWPLCVAIAITLEFVQLYFPPRTVSLNDIVAELIGAALGVLAWLLAGRRLRIWLRQIRAGGPAMVTAVLVFYALLYASLSLFPFDFVLDAREFSWKMQRVGHSWMDFGMYCSSFFPCSSKILIEVIAVIPLGMLMTRVLERTSRQRALLGVAIIAGFTLGLLIEALQLLLVSGNSQIASVVTRALGFGAGVVAMRAIDHGAMPRLYASRKPLLMILTPVYLFGLAYANGWFGGRPVSWAVAKDILGGLNYTPFYYHYFVSEATALKSALTYLALYLPVGVIAGFWRGRAGNRSSLSLFMTVSAAMALATLMELGKLVLAAKTPDPTDVVIAGIAALVGLLISERLLTAETLAPREQPVQHGASGGWLTPLALLAGIAAMVGMFYYPVGRSWLAAALAMYAVILQRFPHAWLVAIPAALPLLDFAQTSGWFFFDEFDIVILATLAVGYWRFRMPENVTVRLRGSILFFLVVLSFSVAMLRGLLPLQPIDASAFSDYRSNYNALRIFKGLLWAVLLLPLLRRARATMHSPERLLALGSTIGLIGVSLLAIRERTLFASAFDYSSDFRVTVFSAMHIGSGVIEGYLTLAIPLAVYLALSAGNRMIRMAAVLGAVLGAYTMMVTFSRGGQFALLAMALILILGVLRVRHAKRSVGVFALLLVLGIVIIPAATGPLMTKRFASIGEDLSRRGAHWTHTIELASPSWLAQIFGHGMGAFPRVYAFGKASASVPANYRFMTEGGNGFLRLAPGQAMYMEQRVALVPGRYRLEFDARSFAAGASLATPLCEKTVLYSRECIWDQTPLVAAPGMWHRYGNGIDVATLGAGEVWGRRPVKLALHLARGVEAVDIDNVRLVSAGGDELVHNGDFESGSQRWFFSIDNLWPWHIENLFLHVWFEHGWLGIVVFVAWLAWLMTTLMHRAHDRELFPLAIFAAFSGFMIVGLFSTLLDSPRPMLLFFLLGLATCVQRVYPTPRGTPRRR